MTVNYDLSSDDLKELREVIKEFLSKYRYLYEIRLQKLIYYSEIYCLDHYEHRITNSKFKPYMYGSFSETVRNELRELDLPQETVKRHGSKTTKYLSYRVDGGELTEGKREIISRIHELTRSKSTDELAEFSKESWLFQRSSAGEEVNFNDYLKHIQDIPKDERELFDSQAPEVEYPVEIGLYPLAASPEIESEEAA